MAGRRSPALGRCPSWPWPPGTGQSRAFARLVSDPRRRRAVLTAASAGTARAWSRPLLGRCAPWGRARRGPFGVPSLWIQSVRPAAPCADLPVSGLRPMAVQGPPPALPPPPRGRPAPRLRLGVTTHGGHAAWPAVAASGQLSRPWSSLPRVSGLTLAIVRLPACPLGAGGCSDGPSFGAFPSASLSSPRVPDVKAC